MKKIRLVFHVLLISLFYSCATGDKIPCPDGKKFCVTPFGNIRKSGEPSSIWTTGVFGNATDLEKLLESPKGAEDALTEYKNQTKEISSSTWVYLGLLSAGVGLGIGLESVALIETALIGVLPITSMQNSRFETQQTLAIQAMNIANGDQKNFSLETRLYSRPRWTAALGGGVDSYRYMRTITTDGFKPQIEASVEHFFDGRHGLGIGAGIVFSSNKMFDLKVGYSNQSFFRMGESDNRIISGFGFLVKSMKAEIPGVKNITGAYLSTEFPLFDTRSSYSLNYAVDLQVLKINPGDFDTQSDVDTVVRLGLKARF